MPQTALFTAVQLGAWLRQDVSAATAVEVEKVVWGWLAPVLASPALTERPETITAAQYSAAIELGGIAFSNPEGLSAYELENEKSIYSSERRDELLRILAAQAGTIAVGLGPPAPVGSFPCAEPYPDPARRISRLRY